MSRRCAFITWINEVTIIDINK